MGQKLPHTGLSLHLLIKPTWILCSRRNWCSASSAYNPARSVPDFHLYLFGSYPKYNCILRKLPRRLIAVASELQMSKIDNSICNQHLEKRCIRINIPPPQHPDSTGSQILSITRGTKTLSTFSNLFQESQGKTTALLEHFHPNIFSSRYHFTAGKPMVQAEHEHTQMEVKKLLINKNSEVLEWLNSRIYRVQNLANFKLELSYLGLYDRLSIPLYSPSVFSNNFNYVLMGRFPRASDFPLLWVKTTNDWFSGS